MTVVAHAARRTSGILGLVICSALLGAEVIRQPSHIRLLAAACVGIAAVVAATQWPRAALVATLALLPYLAVSRRLLLEFTPWKTTDPLLLVAPTVLLVVLVRLYILERRPIGADRVSKLVLFVLALTFLEVFNPRGGGLKAGAVALLFTAVPLLWFFAGRELATPRSMRVILIAIALSGCIVAVYGLDQTWLGLPSWDRMWVNQTNYAALNVGSVIRAFGTFSSAAEYATFLGIATVVAIAFALDRRPYLLPAVPLFAVAIFYESSRATVVTTVGAVIVIIAARTGSMPRTILTLIVLLCTVIVIVVLARGSLERASTSSNALVAHQAGGLLHPLNATTSTLPGHLTMVENGLKHIADPIGQGTASTTIASTRYGSSTLGSTEVDLSNEFVANGTFGGLAYIAVVVLTLSAALRNAVTQRDAVSLSILGILVAAAGQWLDGGFYAVAPIVWFAIGFLIAVQHQRSVPATSVSNP